MQVYDIVHTDVYEASWMAMVPYIRTVIRTTVEETEARRARSKMDLTVTAYCTLPTTSG